MKVIILAAGRGSRLGKFTENLPKSFVNFRGKPLITWILESVKKYFELKDIYIVVGYKSKKFETLGINLIHNSEWERSNIMGSLIVADEILSTTNCLVIYSDIYFEDDAIKLIKESPAPAVLNLVNWYKIWSKRFPDPLVDLENFEYNDKTLELTRIGKRASSIESIRGQFAGIFTTTPDLWQIIKLVNRDLKIIDTTSALQKAITEAAKISVVNYSGNWAEIDTLMDLEQQ